MNYADGDVMVKRKRTLLYMKRFWEVSALHFTGTSGHQRVTTDFFKTISIPIPPRPVQDPIASTASSIRAEARKLKADATAALDAARRKIEAGVVAANHSRGTREKGGNS